LVVGCGGLAHPLLSYLAGYSLAEIALVDGDVVEPSNLDRQFWFGPQHVGEPKAQVLAHQLSVLHPGIVFTPHIAMVDEKNAAELFLNYDVIFSCVDNLAARLCINQACVEQKKPWVNGGAFGWRGEIAAFIPKNGCYNCLFPEKNIASRPPSETCAPGQVLSPLCGVVGSWMAAVALPLLETPDHPQKNQEKKSENILYTLNFSPENAVGMRTVKWKRDPQCVVCSAQPL
jgi:molybdopterin/thiamine biosynthesis adenylyltransferase